MVNMITLAVGDDVTIEMFKSYINEKAYSQIDLRDILPVQPIEMTEAESVLFYDYLEDSNLADFLDVVTSGVVLEDAYSAFWNISLEDLAQAWLHPETIKVVE